MQIFTMAFCGVCCAVSIYAARASFNAMERHLKFIRLRNRINGD